MSGATWDRFAAAVDRGRAVISAYLSGCAVLSEIEQWRRSAGPAVGSWLPPVFSAGLVVQARDVAETWSSLERARAAVELGDWGYRPDGRGDLDIVGSPGDTVGALPAVWPIGTIVIAGAIAVVTAMITKSQRDADRISREIRDIDARMALHPDPAVRADYLSMIRTPAIVESRGILDRLAGGVGNVIGIAALVGLGVLLLSSRGRGDSPPVRPPPRRSVELEPNPCGAKTPPWDWRVNWSQDPAKFERQVEQVLSQLSNKSVQKWGRIAREWAQSYQGVPF